MAPAWPISIGIRNAAGRVRREVENGFDVCVIVSAMAGKTNEMVGWVRETTMLYDAREYDAVVASGDRSPAAAKLYRRATQNAVDGTRGLDVGC